MLFKIFCEETTGIEAARLTSIRIHCFRIGDPDPGLLSTNLINIQVHKYDKLDKNIATKAVANKMQLNQAKKYLTPISGARGSPTAATTAVTRSAEEDQVSSPLLQGWEGKRCCPAPGQTSMRMPGR